MNKFTRIVQRIPKRNFFCVLNEFERGVKLNFGKFNSVVEPGLRLYIPLYHDIIPIDIRDMVKDIEKLSLITSDNITLYVDASVQYKIIDPKKAILNIHNVHHNILERCKMQIRHVLCTKDLNSILRERDIISKEILAGFQDIEKDWGVKIMVAQIKDIEIEESMRRVIAVRAEATRNAEAKIINAEADVETAEKYSKAAAIYAENPITLRLREFQLWNSVSKNPNSTIYVVPSDLLTSVSSIVKKKM
jgi:regulator of protease activity HflC (stomatin/prohibitin superfamily)